VNSFPDQPGYVEPVGRGTPERIIDNLTVHPQACVRIPSTNRYAAKKINTNTHN
jgi:hypothetical protein